MLGVPQFADAWDDGGHQRVENVMAEQGRDHPVAYTGDEASS